MDKERVAEAAGGLSSSMAAPRDAASCSDTPPEQPAPPLQHSQPPSHGHSRVAPEHQHSQSFRPLAEPELGHVITRLEQQVSFNYSMIQGHHGDIQRVSEHVGRLQLEMGQVIGVIEDMRKDILSGRFSTKSLHPSRYDPADVGVLANQIANVNNKASEVDNVKVMIELMKQRLKRLESGTTTPGPQPEATAGRPDPHYEALRARQLQQATGHPQSSIRPGAALPSEHGKQPGHPSAPVLEPQLTPSFHAAHERQANATEQAQQAARQPCFRGADPLQPPNALSGRRPAESFPHSGGPPPPAHSHPLRLRPPNPQASGWAAVNLSQAAKRSLDEHHPQHDSSQPGSPKRPKAVPLKPRSSFGDDHHQSPYAQPAHVEVSHQARGRIPSGDVPLQPHPQMNPAPASGQAAGNQFQFVTSTGQPPDSQEHWCAAEGDPATGARFEHTTGGTGRGRGRGSRGRRRGGRGGWRSSSGAANIPPPASDAPPSEHVHSIQGPPAWREHQWAATQHPAASNGHYPGQHAYSPIDAARQPPDLTVHTGAPQHGMSYPAGHEHESPTTSVASNAGAYSMANDLDSANRKTRSKPIRNSDGVLIRKDGLPDMRSVSSANNLRKLHAHKEAEKVEMERRTPTSGRSLAPANSSSLSDDEGMEGGDYMELEGEIDREHSEGRNGIPGMQHDAELPESLLRHHELMSRIFNENSVRSKGTAEAWFPRVEGPSLDAKREDHENKEREARCREMEDTTMRDTEPGGEREASALQLPSAEQVFREQTSVEATPNVAVVSKPAASEQPDSEVDAAGENTKEAGKKD